MKKGFWIALTLFLSIGATDVSAQSFLKKLKKTVEKEVENRVTEEVKKQVNKGLDKTIDVTSGNHQRQENNVTMQQQPNGAMNGVYQAEQILRN